MREIDKISEDLFDKIRSRFENVSVGDENANSTDKPEKARFFNFDFVSEIGKNFGNMTISLIDDNSLKIYFSKDITAELDDVDKKEWYDFLRNLRNFAKRNLLTFDTRDINRSNLQIRDVKQVSRAGGVYDKSEVDVKESRMFGSSRSSYQSMGPVKLIVRHTNNIDENIHGARARNIESIFVETHLGERFLLPFKKLTPARAMAQHISQGGNLHDDLGRTITEMVSEMTNLSFFVRNMRRRTFEDAVTTTMVEASIERYAELHNVLSGMRGPKGYKKFAESFQPQEIINEEELDIDELRERFVKKIYDDRLSEALPHVYRAYKNKKKFMENNYVTEFETWTDQITEGTWAVPETDQDKEELRKLMAEPIIAGQNGDDAAGLLYDLIGSDSLFDEFYQASKSQDGIDTDVRPLIIDWLKEHGYQDLAEEFEQVINQDNTNMTVAPTTANVAPTTSNVNANVSPTIGSNVQTSGTTESITTLKRLAGLIG